MVQRAMETTLVKGLKILELVAHSRGPRGVSELARELSITRSNAHRLLQTLSALGYLRHDAKLGQYEATLRLFELGSAVASQREIRTAAQPIMRTLVREVEENVILTVRDGCETVVLDRFEGTRTVRTYTPLDARRPMHCNSPGKLIIAHTTEDIVRDIMRSLNKFTARTITTTEKMQSELVRIRAQGFSTARAEWREDVGGVCAPIMHADGSVIAGLSVSGPIGRFKPAQMKAYLPPLLKATRDISERLGYQTEKRG
jgi:DNA-binding IclR family transcriptional regulator